MKNESAGKKLIKSLKEALDFYGGKVKLKTKKLSKKKTIRKSKSRKNA